MHTPHRDDPENRNLENESGEETPQQPKAGLEQQDPAAGVLGGKRKDSDTPTGSKLSDLIYILDEDVPDDGSNAATRAASGSDEAGEDHSGIGPLADVPGVDYLDEEVAPSPSISFDNLPSLPDDNLAEHEDTVVTNIEQLRAGNLDFEGGGNAEAEEAFDGLFNTEPEDYGMLGGNAPHRGEDFYTHDRPPTPEELATQLGDDTDDLYGSGEGEDESYAEDEIEEYDDAEGQPAFDSPQSWYEEDELLPEANLVLVSSRHSAIPWTVGLIVTALACFGVGGYLYQKRLDSQQAWTGNDAATASTQPVAVAAGTPALPPLAPQQNADLGTGLGLIIAQVTTMPFDASGATGSDVTPTQPVETPPVVAVAEGPTQPDQIEAPDESPGSSFPETARPPIDDPSLSGDFIRSVPEPSPQAERIRRTVMLTGDVTVTLFNGNAFRGHVHDFDANQVEIDLAFGRISFPLDEVRHLVPREGTMPIDVVNDQPVASGRKGAISLEYFVSPQVDGDSPTLIAAESDLVSTIHVDVAKALGEELANPELDDPTRSNPLAQPVDGLTAWPDEAASTSTTPEKKPTPLIELPKNTKKSSKKPKKSNR